MFIISRQHTENRFYFFPCDIAKRPRPRQDLHHLIQLIASKRRHRNQVLRKYIQTFRGRIQMLHASPSGKLRCHTAGHTLRRRSWKQIHHTDSARIMSRPSKPLHGAGNRTRTADLQHLINFSYVNTQLHGGSGA